MDRKQKLHEWIKRNKAREAKSNRTRVNTGDVSKQGSMPSKSSYKDKEIAHLKAQIKDLHVHQINEDKKRDQKMKREQAVKDNHAIHDVEDAGASDPLPRNRFDKTYHLHYLNPATGKRQAYSLHFVIRPASLLDQSAIDSEVTHLTNYLGKYYQINDYDMYRAFAVLKVLGIKVPKGFSDPAKIYRTDILAIVYIDYLKWEANFRRYSMD